MLTQINGPQIRTSESINHEFLDEDDRRVLIVDDEKAVRKVIASYLDSKYDCVMAADAQEALDRLAEKPFALALLDVQMPGLSGIELLRKIVSDFPQVAVIMASGVDRTQRVRDALRIGAFDYLIKPIDFDVLAITVERALERRSLVKKNIQYNQDLETRNRQLAEQKAKLEHLQAQLVQNEKMASLGQLAGGVAHELNNPAGFIFSNMESLSEYLIALERLFPFYERIPLPQELQAEAAKLKQEIKYEELLPELSSIVADCQEGARRINDIVLNLRTFSRLDQAEVKKINIHEGIDATIRLLSQYYKSNYITLIRDYGDLPPVECFAGQLNQVWMNLLRNAAQAVGSGPGTVRIQTGISEEFAFVTISDTGCGIAPEHLSKIFDPFFTTKNVGEGTGLGLSITYGIVEKHGGTIRVKSTPGQGTTFTTLLPLKPQLGDNTRIDSV
ncbi:MAG TPA: ATP-binding protein [Pyrinomonadaceae bacterium]|nr:ATP-binding protein [Pyrinomonadaceae bacterium]